MRRAFVVAVMLTMMLGLRALQVDGVGGTNPLTLATIGFVVLAAFAIAELGGSLSLPKVTGYILGGIALGPYAGNIMSMTVVEDMRMFNSLALGLIATTAGLELDLGGLKKLAKTLGATIMLKILLGVVLVGGTLVVVEGTYGILGLADSPSRMAVALVFAALSLGTSPAIALAIISESSAKGRLSELILGAAIVKDVVVVVCLAIAVATAKALTGGGALGVDVLVHVGEELGRSILAGSILGVLLVGYLKYVKAEMLLFVCAMVLVVAEVSAALHLELLLVFIVAGVVVRNFSQHEHDLLHPLERVSLPVFVVFFTNAGASVDLRATMSVLPLALALCGARAVGYILSSWLGGRFGGESPQVRKLAWLGYLPQAGVTLGLIGLASAQLGAELGASIATLGMAVVAVNLLVGPVTLRVALKTAGEVGGEAQDTETEAVTESVPGPGDPAAEIEDERLASIVQQANERARKQVETWVTETAEPRARAFADQCLKALRDSQDIGRIRKLTSELSDLAKSRPSLEAPQLFAKLAAGCRDLPEQRQVALERRHREPQPTDGRLRALRKRAASVLAFITFRSKRRRRTVPVLTAGRSVLEPRFVELVGFALNESHRFEARIAATLNDCANGEIALPDAVLAIEDLAQRFPEDAAQATGVRVDACFTALTEVLCKVDTPDLPLRSVRYSTVERDVRSGIERLEQDGGAWSERLAAALATVKVATQLAVARNATETALETKISGPVAAAFAGCKEAAFTLRRRVGELADKVKDLDAERLSLEVRALLPKPVAKEYRAAISQLRKAPSAERLVEPLMPDVEERVRMVRSLDDWRREGRLATAKTEDVLLRERVHAKVFEGLVEPLHDALEAARSQVEEDDKQIADALGLMEFLARGVAEAEDEGAVEARKAFAGGISQVGARFETVLAAIDPRADAFAKTVAEALDESYGALASLTAGTTAALTRHGEVLATPTAGSRMRAAIAARLAPAVETVRRLLRGEAEKVARLRKLHADDDRFDPGDIREFVAERSKQRAVSNGPAVYEQLFSTDPLRDPMLFSAHRRQLEAVVGAERTWVGDRSAGNAVLVVGSSGSGKTSMLAVGRMKIGIRRSIQVERRRAGAPITMLEELAKRLGCEPTRESVIESMNGDRVLILVDDLHSRPECLDDLLALIVATRQSTFWCVAIDRHAFDVLDETTGLRGWFAQVCELPALDGPAIADVCQIRHRPTASPLVFPELGLTARFNRLRPAPLDEAYFSELAERSEGNLRQAIALWRSHSKADADVVRMEPVPPESCGYPFWRSLDVDALAVCRVLLAGGPQTAEALRDEMLADVSRTLHLLTTAGLVRVEDGEYEVLDSRRDDIESALVQAGVLRRSRREVA